MTTWRVMLDTNIISHIMRYPNGAPAMKLAEHAPNELAISTVVLAELLFGASKARSDRLLTQIRFVIKTLAVLPLDAAASECYGHIRAELERTGRLIGGNDLFIAAHALSLGATLVTDNVREFSRVADLRVENWLD
jgi:tRNA(fMet)-specific endonuclease VapC